MRNFAFYEPTFSFRVNPLEICQTIYDGNAFDTRNWIHGFKNNPEMLPEIVLEFLALLEEYEVDFCIVGGIAYLAYIEDRNTKDLDLIVSVKELEKILPFVEVTNTDVNFTNAEYKGLRIDFLKTSNSLFQYIKKNETVMFSFVEGAYPIATLEGLVLMRFDAVIDLYQKGNFKKAMRYENDLRFITVNYEVDWSEVWEVAETFFTAGQVKEFRRQIDEWQKPRLNPFAS